MIRQTEVGEGRLIRVRTAESRTFSEAYLVLRRKARRAPICDIVAEAERVIRDCERRAAVRPARRRRQLAVFFLGLLSGVAAASATVAVTLLCLCR